ncbi:MAG: substrate-binding domain-containing protein, partial [Deltaproteobacteria bacterium]|nr:substrate-binding domain-containing protein [Deltaproteobacteria bacterium]
FDDIQIATFVTPTLTTISQPAYNMGSLGAEILLDHISKRPYKPVHKILETRLVVRESTAIAPNT